MAEVPRTVDYQLGDAVRIRLHQATEAERAIVRRQTGLSFAEPAGEPDLEIRFVDRLTTNGPMRYVGPADAGYDDDCFFILRGRHKTAVRVSLPVEALGARAEIVCERGLGTIPYLLGAINLAALAKGYVALHASAFVHRGRGVLVTGWAKGGKTETLLAFASRGARYVGDEWVYLAADGSRMFGIPEPIRVWSWHLDQLPELRRRVGAPARTGLAAVAGARRVVGALPGRRTASNPLARGARRVHGLLGDQMAVRIPPRTIFGREGVVEASTVDHVVLVVSSDRPEFEVTPADPGALAARMAASVSYEGLPLWTLYLAHRFAFPERRNALLERAGALGEERLRVALAGRHALEVRHPYPFAFDAMYRALEPHLGPA